MIHLQKDTSKLDFSLQDLTGPRLGIVPGTWAGIVNAGTEIGDYQHIHLSSRF